MSAQPNKAQLRSELRQRRQALSQPQQRAAAEAAASHLMQLPGWAQARRIALYLAQDGEIDTSPISELCRKPGIQLFLPVIGPDDSLTFARWQTDEPLLTNRYGIPEPATAAQRCAAAELDILVLPLVGWDRRGGRLGMGGGFYDRSLAGVTDTLLVGLAHSVQELEQVPQEQWDISMDYVVTDTGVHSCRERK